MLLGRKRALRELDAFRDRFEQWLRNGNDELRGELLASIPKLEPRGA